MRILPSVIPLLVSVLLAVCKGARGQGSVNAANSPTTLFRTNAIAFGGSSGSTLSAAGPWYFEVLTAPSTVTSVDPSLQQLLSPPWSDTGIEATNTALAGRMASANNTANFWPAGQTNSFIVVGWSGGLGASWAAVAPRLSGAVLSAAGWSGGGLYPGGINFLGATTVGFRQAGGVVGVNTIPTPLLFGVGPDAQGNPITGSTDLWIAAPEPGIAGLILAAMLAAAARRNTFHVRTQDEVVAAGKDRASVPLFRRLQANQESS